MILGVEWGLAEERKRTLYLPLTTLSDHYRKEGYKVTGINLVWKHCYNYDRDISGSRQLAVIQKKYPKATLSKRPDGSYHYVDKAKTPEIEIQLELIPKNEKKEEEENGD
mgnify:FL=1